MLYRWDRNSIVRKCSPSGNWWGILSQEKPIIIHKKLDKLLVENLNEVLAMYNCGIKLTFTDIKAIKNIMEKDLGK